MRSSTTLLLATAALTTTTLAQSTSVTSLFIPQGGDTQPLDASIVGAHAATTTWAINCPANEDASDCGYEGAFTFTLGPSFYEAQTTEAPVFSYSVHCDLDGTTVATCTESAGGQSANFPGSSVETYTGTDVGGVQVVTVTAGLEKLSGATGGASASATGAASASATGASASNTGSPVASNTGSAVATNTGLSSQSASLTKLIGTKTTIRTEAGTATGTAADATSTGAADGRAAMGMSAAGLVGVALVAFAL
ncbi:uncharacterized protein BDZ99DRAFT_480179 [Mytilinidion resinicola]|uniref:GPI anchored protein n=1 Tax=Mytilinidion resinicola TaxID=574789 RepID=A0A6A6YBH1_9PEZI|nr:uncharacterized protein BDZ99DRAFT_480179 [Mytilinidion resinicola]KAF2805455.1 hypothetical protein BDZ99DRAFT_480179 [Mytilinidion resinicola]